MRQYAGELVEKVKAEAAAKEFLIDRRMINTFLVQYLSPKSDQATKQHMLTSMSKVLGFTMEEKQTLGLVERQQIESQDRAPKDLKGMGTSLISFLMGDDDFD